MHALSSTSPAHRGTLFWVSEFQSTSDPTMSEWNVSASVLGAQLTIEPHGSHCSLYSGNVVPWRHYAMVTHL